MTVVFRSQTQIHWTGVLTSSYQGVCLIMRRQQQNISFVAIIGILMSIAFFFFPANQ